MKREFTYDIYYELASAIKEAGYTPFPFIDIISNGHICEKYVVMKHDVDKLPKNALQMADIENSIGIKTSYYFRSVDRVYDETIIVKIAELGHEVSYHYEDLSLCNGSSPIIETGYAV